jgi:Fe-S cluster assembly scaffold protein SufB
LRGCAKFVYRGVKQGVMHAHGSSNSQRKETLPHDDTKALAKFFED